jgi:selenocysteine lyase/cysteine desulfurase
MLEPGLQNFAGIIGFGEALRWVQDFSYEGKGRMEYEEELAGMLFDGLQELPVNVVNASASPVVSFYHEKVDGHQIGSLLSSKNIMCRTGYFCCHGYLVHDRELPPLARVSLGLYNTEEDIEKFLTTMKFITDNL